MRAREITAAVDALPRTLQTIHERDVTRCLRVVGGKHLGKTEWGMRKVRERLKRVFAAVDEDTSG